MENNKTLYRYCETSDYSELVLEKYFIVKETEKTYVIRYTDGNRYISPFDKRIYKQCERPFVHDNEDDALKAYFFRKRKQVHLLENNLYSAEYMKKKHLSY